FFFFPLFLLFSRSPAARPAWTETERLPFASFPATARGRGSNHQITNPCVRSASHRPHKLVRKNALDERLAQLILLAAHGRVSCKVHWTVDRTAERRWNGSLGAVDSKGCRLQVAIAGRRHSAALREQFTFTRVLVDRKS